MVLVMEEWSDLSEKQTQLLMEFADVSFDLKRAVEFELAIREKPELIDWAMTNREIRTKLSRLPVIGAAPGFLDRLEIKLREQYPTV